MHKKISLVLSGGGARGLAHIGVIEELEKQGFEITSISGTSMGALIGGLYASGKLQDFKNWIVKLDKYEVFKLIDFSISRQGFIKGDRVFIKMKEFFSDSNIEDLPLDFTATATDLLNNKEVVFKKGSLFDAIRASISIPSVFTPVKFKNTLLVDGGVINNLPIEHVKQFSDSSLIVVDVNSDVDKFIIKDSEKVKKEKAEIKKSNDNFIRNFFGLKTSKTEEDADADADNTKDLNYFHIMDKTVDILADQVSKYVLDKYKPEILIKISRKTCSTFDFYKATKLIELGKLLTEKEIAIYKKDFDEKSWLFKLSYKYGIKF